MTTDDVVIVSAKRTAIGAFQGVFAPMSATQLGSAAIAAAIKEAGLEPADIQEVIVGCVLPAGLGQSPARQASLGAGIPNSVPTTTINKVCGSSLKAVMYAADQIRNGDIGIIVAAGMESMTNAPYLLPKARAGLRMGHAELLDHMFFDGLQNAYDGQSMGVFADRTATKFGFSRAEQDAYAEESVRRAVKAGESGAFKAEIVPVTVKGRKGETVVDRDETPLTIDIKRIPTLKAAFVKDGTVTAASSSSISDGASALVIMSGKLAASKGLKPLARIKYFASHANEPEWFTTAPVGAIKKVLARLDWQAKDVDLFEINEAFAAVAMAAMRDVGIEHSQINVNGGACALGHPLGATGGRILTTLVHALRQRGGKRGIASLCIGGGEAVAVAIEAI